jgi:hypothetical protein
MTPDASNLPNLAQDLVRIHHVITRGLNTGLKSGTEFLHDGFPDRDLQRGYRDYIRSLGSVLGAHHLGEDEIAFPALKEKLPGAPYKRLAADHKKIEAALTSMNAAFSSVPEANPVDGLGGVVNSLRKILAIWPSHIGVEESSFGASAIEGAMTPVEQAEVSIRMAKHSQEHSSPPFLVLPFVLYNLAGADREAMAAAIPAPVMSLMDKDWKDQWKLMKPFLLD